MSESQVQYFKLLEKKYDIEEDIYKKLGELQDQKKKIAKLYREIAKDNREREQQLIKKADFEAQNLSKDAQKCIVVIKKRETSIAQKEYKIKDIESKIASIEEDLSKLEAELKKAESDIESHLTQEKSSPKAPIEPEEKTELEPSVLEDTN
ncbi:MAG: hypothetical protein ACTSSG_12155 [Candidatus Heimdallarchaeaceae archaeon]